MDMEIQQLLLSDHAWPENGAQERGHRLCNSAGSGQRRDNADHVWTYKGIIMGSNTQEWTIHSGSCLFTPVRQHHPEVVLHLP